MRILLNCLALLALVLPPNLDLDRDGIGDAVEQKLLVQFAPTLMISADECDVLPAEFLPDSQQPKMTARNGTLYGQVFKNGAATEIHYYHLWNRDCGRGGHALDAEHVSVLVSENGKALYWYAAAHEDTICDASNGARAALLEAEDRGATIWVSRGKHASFLSAGICRLGCGGDLCKRPQAMLPGKLINIGEPGVPLNGALWMASSAWPLSAKMQPDFNDAVIAQLRKHNRIDGVNSSEPAVKAFILGSDAGLTGFTAGNREGGKALVTGGSHTAGAAVTAWKQTARSLGIAARSVGRPVGRLLGISPKE